MPSSRKRSTRTEHSADRTARGRMLPTTFFVLGLTFTAPGQKVAPGAALKDLEGTWRVVAAEEKGAAATIKDLADSPQWLVVRGDMATVQTKGEVWGEFRLTV